MSIADVAHRTRIPARVIEALEKDDYGSFPSPTYAKSFLAQYAEFVGIDPSRWMDFFEPVAFTGPDDVLSIVDAPEPSHHHTHHYHDASVSEPRHLRRSSGVASTVMLILLTGGVIYACVWAIPLIEKKYGGADTHVPPAPPKFIEPHAKSLPAESPATTPAGSQNDPTMTASKPASSPPGEPIPRAIVVPES
ncbi:helix-turn-helix domain-containing protein [Luteolibacter ambystomatis]|uniref:Helix-turn-helix domain-containing protein n=2 Tax=Luteolibacter ambystomatis TaxID=2824561 RepID=A0A975G6R2_9BACT|nr:helix-turn-helix domain-containing protein [Luteolibacter ambystomatis]